jgi:hypothetical protein
MSGNVCQNRKSLLRIMTKNIRVNSADFIFRNKLGASVLKQSYCENG